MALEASKSLILVVARKNTSHYDKLRKELGALLFQGSVPFFLEMQFVGSLEEAFSALTRLDPVLCFVHHSAAEAQDLRRLFLRIRECCIFPGVLVLDDRAREAESYSLAAGDFLYLGELTVSALTRLVHLSRMVQETFSSLARRRIDSGTGDQERVRHLESTLLDAELRFHAVAESLAEGLSIFDCNGVLQYCNAQFAQLTDSSREQLYGKRLY